MSDITLELTAPQLEFLTTPEKFALFTGGLGTGKSFVLCLYVILTVDNYPEAQGLITNNTYKQLQDSTLTTMFRMLTDLRIPFSYNSSRGELKIRNTKIHCRSMENYDTLRGAEYGWAASDEVAFYRKEAVDVLLGRLRDKKGPLEWRAVTTTNGYNWLWEMFVQNRIGMHVRSASWENPHLPQEYLQSLLEQYDPKLAAQELKGEFVNLTSGKVYYSFDRNIHVQSFPLVNNPIYVGVDFNVNPITATAMYVAGDKIYVLDEIYIKDSNTYQLAKEIKKRWPNAIVVPDSTGKARKTSATMTDHQILQDAGLKLVYNPNPHVKDRYNCINGLLHNNKIVIAPKCVNLIKDLEQLTYENKDPMLSHISDAFGYAVWHLKPLQPARMPSRSHYY